MNETLVTMVGNVASAVSYAQTSAGVPVANFRMAATERRYDRGKGDWVDGDTNWVTVVAWRWLATNVVSSVNKGDPVVVSGRLRVREWGEEDRRRCVVEIDARAVGHDLARGTSAFRWAVQPKPELEAARSGRSGRPELATLPAAASAGSMTSVEDAVPDWIVAAVRERRALEAAGAASGRGVAKAAGAADADMGVPPAEDWGRGRVLDAVAAVEVMREDSASTDRATVG